MNTQREEFLKLAEAIKGHLPGWSVQTVDDWDTAAQFTSANESLMFHLVLNRHDQRLHVLPLYNGLQQYLPYNAPSLSITISPTRPPATIAADISRRFLPNFRQLIESCRQVAIQFEATIAQAEANADTVARASGNLISRRHRPHNDAAVSLHGSHTVNGQYCYFTFEVYPHNSTLTAHRLPLDLAVKLATTLADYLTNPQTD